MRDIPNYLDDQQQILFWEFDEVILLSIMFSIGIIVNQLSILIIIGLVGIKFFRKVKDRQANPSQIRVTALHSIARLDKLRPAREG